MSDDVGPKQGAGVCPSVHEGVCVGHPLPAGIAAELVPLDASHGAQGLLVEK